MCTLCHSKVHMNDILPRSKILIHIQTTGSIEKVHSVHTALSYAMRDWLLKFELTLQISHFNTMKIKIITSYIEIITQMRYIAINMIIYTLTYWYFNLVQYQDNHNIYRHSITRITHFSINNCRNALSMLKYIFMFISLYSFTRSNLDM